MTETCSTCRGRLIGGTHVVRIGDDWTPRAAPRCAVQAEPVHRASDGPPDRVPSVGQE
jgi:hypothetical protein